VFPAGVDGVYRHNPATGQSWSGDPIHLPSGNNKDWPQTSIDDFNIEGDYDWFNDDNGVDTTSNGLYWFWDSIWSEPQL
jgi:hypothetical protein